MKNKSRYWLGVTVLTALLSVGTASYSHNVLADANNSANTQQVPNATNLVSPNSNATWNLSADGTLTISGTTLAGADAEADLYQGLDKDKVNKIVIANKMTGDKNLMHLFSDFSKVTEIDGLSNLDTSQSERMLGMFFGLSDLKSLDLSNFSTASANDMDSMFDNDSSLTSLDISKFDTSKVTDMNSMFLGDSSLTSLNLSNFNTKNVNNSMTYMFYNDSALTSLDLSSFDTSSVRTMVEPFTGATNLWQLKLGEGVTKPFLTSLPAHAAQTAIPGTSNTATGPGWMAVDAGNGGTVNNPQGKTVYDSTFSNWTAPATPETYVWEQKSTPVALQTITVETVDSATQQPIPGTTPQTLTGYPSQSYNVDNAKYRPAISGYTWDGKVPANATGNYQNGIVVKYSYTKNSNTTGNTSGTATATPTTGSTSSNTTNPTNSSSSLVGSSTNSSSSVPTTKPTTPTTTGSAIAAKGEAIYATKKVGLYKTTSFTKGNRVAWYPKQKRVSRPMFVVTGYKRATNGALRYKVRDVNHERKTAGKTGYITASQKYVVPVYYASVPKAKKITVIAKKGVNAYKSANLIGKAKHYKKGAHLTVKKLVKHNLATRYQLSNGQYVTANKKLIIAGRY